MSVFQIDRDQWLAGIEKLKGAYRVFGPEAKQAENENAGDLRSDFKLLGEGQVPDLGHFNTHLSPKALVSPQSAAMFAYSLDESEEDHHQMREVPGDATPWAVVGIRPCDAAAFLLVKRNFDTPQYQDPYWLRAYDNISFIGHACDNPCSTCFCTTASCGPYHETGLDVLLIDRDDGYLAKALTEKGKALLAAAGWDVLQAVSDTDELIAEREQAAEAKIGTSVNTARLKEIPTMDLYDAPFWEDVSFSCINCGTCTFVCPTCWCFDIQDENCGQKGLRMRNWDSCMFPLFTLHGTGHNPRGQKLHRVRQRFMHKLKYYVEKYEDGIQCVGCGRCIRMCPVNIDIRRVCDLMNEFESAPAGS